MALLENILSRPNLTKALKRVKAHKGAPGINGVSNIQFLGEAYISEADNDVSSGYTKDVVVMINAKDTKRKKVGLVPITVQGTLGIQPRILEAARKNNRLILTNSK